MCWLSKIRICRFVSYKGKGDFFPASYVRLPEGQFHQKKAFSFDQQNWVVQPAPFELRQLSKRWVEEKSMSKTIITPQKSNIDTKKHAIFQGRLVTFSFRPIILGMYVRMNKATDKHQGLGKIIFMISYCIPTCSSLKMYLGCFPGWFCDLPVGNRWQHCPGVAGEIDIYIYNWN